MKKNLVIMLVLICVVCVSTGNVHAAALEVTCEDCTNAAVGSNINCKVSINSAPNDVYSFGFIFSYNPDILEYKACPADDPKCKQGIIFEDNSGFFFDVNEISSNQLKCGGYGIEAIPANTSGELVNLTFEVKANGECSAELSHLTDDFKCWSASPPIVPEVPDGQSFKVRDNSKNNNYVGEIAVNNYNVTALAFSITGGNTDNVFTINDSGIIIVRNSEFLNYMNTPEYSLTVEVLACDEKTQTTVNINVEPVKGNVNDDTNIDLKDAVLTLKALTGTDIQNNELSLAADINNDSRIGIEEAVYILKGISNSQ